MGYFSEILAEPAAKQAGRLSLDELLRMNVVGGDVFRPLTQQLGIEDWQISGGGMDESGGPINTGVADPAKLAALQGYTFDWQDTGPANTGTLTAYDPTGKSVGAFNQQDQSTGSALAEFAALAAAGFGGAGLLGLGPLGGVLGGIGGASTAVNPAVGNGAFLGETASMAAGGAGSAGVAGSGIAGSGLTAGGTYGTIGANSAALGAGGAGLSSGVGMTAPAFAGGSAGITGGLGMTAGAGAAAGAGGLSGILGTIGGYLPAAKSLASIASGLYGMKLAGDAREASDPFAQYRGAYGERLAALEANPGSIVTRPGFQAGLETIQRKSAGSGYYGSGNMAAALSRYSGDFYNQEASRLAGLAGAGQTPGAGQALGADLASQSLGSIGYGIGPLLERLTRGG
jgi:hypothetical protein